MHDLATHHRHENPYIFDLLLRNREIVPVQNDKIGPLAGLEGTQYILLHQVVSAPTRDSFQRQFPADLLTWCVNLSVRGLPTNGARQHPKQGQVSSRQGPIHLKTAGNLGIHQ